MKSRAGWRQAYEMISRRLVRFSLGGESREQPRPFLCPENMGRARLSSLSSFPSPSLSPFPYLSLITSFSLWSLTLIHHLLNKCLVSATWHPRWLSGKELSSQCRRGKKRHRFNPWVREIPWRRAWQPTPVFLPGESHGLRSLGATVHGVTKESNVTKQTTKINIWMTMSFWNKTIPTIVIIKYCSWQYLLV